MNNFLNKFATVTRFFLIAGIVVIAILLIVGTPSGAMPNPLAMKRASAEGGISAAPGFLALSTTPNGEFYIIDTNKKIICVYSLDADKLHLVSARKFDSDTEILTGEIPSVKLPAGLINAGNGVTRAEAIDYAADSKKFFEEYEKRIEKKFKK